MLHLPPVLSVKGQLNVMMSSRCGFLSQHLSFNCTNKLDDVIVS